MTTVVEEAGNNDVEMVVIKRNDDVEMIVVTGNGDEMVVVTGNDDDYSCSNGELRRWLQY